jgi:hypothetical protein
VTKYLRVTISGPYNEEIRYVPLDDGVEYSWEELQQIGQDVVNEVYSWGIDEELLDEEDVPEEGRVQ